MNSVEHATKPLLTPEFSRRAARAWVRAADAALIDADELVWLLAHLEPDRLGAARPGTSPRR
ncbi:hypothetical protein AB0F91_43230 [Amycolatopsis sp. NPDC023774]|uniref:hypothetical protein n=1 Tax=Amycolatopsis sp. NPDC023774 TaxID=3155015 RepID=UPI00340370D9